MEWHRDPPGPQVGLLKHFLSVLKLGQQNNPAKKARSLNLMLKRSGGKGKLVNVKLSSKCGRKAWVADKATFRDLYNML